MNNDLSEFGLSDEELFSHVDHSELESEKITAPRYSYWQSVFRVFFKKKINIFILVVLAIIIGFAYLYPPLIEYDKFANLLDASAKHLHPLPAMQKMGYNIHWILGAGAAGQSTFDAIWVGSRISISLALICAAINMTVGVIAGALWGFSRKVEIFMMELFNIVYNVPYLLVCAVLVMLFTPSFWVMVFVPILDKDHIILCLGTSTVKIAIKNILPFMTSVIVTLLATEIPYYISMEVFLSYVGLGLSDMSLGRLIYESESAMVTPGWGFEFWSPVAVASIIAVVLYVAGQNLGDASDPRTHM